MGYADPNERFQEICDIYLETDGLMIKGKWDEAKYLLEKNLEQFPESRHLHKQLAQVLWYSYNDKNQSILERAIKEAERALNIGLSFGTVDYHLTGLLSRLLGESKDVKTLDRIFKRVFAIESSAVVYLDYAQALNQINEPRDRENKSSETLQVTTAISDAQAIKGLSYLIWGEARGESRGGMRAEGWVVRSRVLRGSVGSPACPYVVNTGSTLADQYKSVMCQSGQFYGMCLAWCSDPNTTKCTDNSTTFNVANDVIMAIYQILSHRIAQWESPLGEGAIVQIAPGVMVIQTLLDWLVLSLTMVQAGVALLTAVHLIVLERHVATVA